MMASEYTSSRGKSAAELSQELRAAIMRGDFVSNQRLVEADIAHDFGASRGNVRAALAELSVEGLIERIPNRGARVRSVTVEEAIEIVEVRGAIESLCARKAAEKITPAHEAELRELGREMERAVAAGDIEAYTRGNERLHARLIEIADQHTAAVTIERLQGQAVRYQFRLSTVSGRPQVSLPEHLAIIEAVCAGDGDAAALAMQRHLMSVADAIRKTPAGAR
ncbi:DNA-binding GntR family transcriptional regulator [Neomicrococcus lactis]|uniref:DNA-binding GntR family transcriptional regulator n=2 Tax=Neomicrococcus lactis TaxID=732241 RepID=A0A7W8Y8W1_9MICC|nr:DNA-binding GntR family transcriptional regulator [Neomicrococcus lactis]